MNSKLLKNYILGNFATVFFPIFGALFSIASIIMLIKIAHMTSYIKISFAEIIEFYLYSMPQIVLHILPISFFAGMVISLAKLSFDLELIVVFTLGANIKKIISPFIFLSILVMITLLITGLVLRPLSRYKTKEFVYLKEDSAQVNIKPSEFGQKFGNWMLFVNEKNGENNYKDLILYSNQDKYEVLIKSKKANLSNKSGEFKLNLEKGESYFIKDTVIDQIEYKKMAINESSNLSILNFNGVIFYWKRLINNGYAKDFVNIILIAIFPVISLLLGAVLGVFNPRYEKNRSSTYVILTITLYYFFTFLAVENFPIISLFMLPLLWFLASYFLYKKTIKPYY